MEDVEAIQRFQAGDPEAFREIFLRHRGRVYAQAYHMLGEEGLALDVVQEAFLVLLRRLPAWEAGTSLGAWLAGAAWRCAQVQRRRRLPVGKDLEKGIPPLPDALEKGEEKRILWEAVGTLPEREREAVLLRYAQGMLLEEVALCMGIDVKTVSSHLSRASGILRERIAKKI